MVITGYPPQDLLFSNTFIEKNLEVLDKFSKKVSSPCIVGFVDEKDGKLFNAAALCQDGKISNIYHKILLPNYDVFDERRYFQSGSDIGIFDININGKNYSYVIQICEDLWEDNYDRKLSEEIIQINPDMIINISASPYCKNRDNDRKILIKEKFKKSNSFFIYCNLVGGQDELIFDGNSMIFAPGMDLINSGLSFQEDILVQPLYLESSRDSMEDFMNSEAIIHSASHSNILEDNILNALTLGIKDYFYKTGHKKL